MVHAIAPADFDRLKTLDTCSVSNAIERLNVRLRNEGFVHDAGRCLFPGLPPMLGYAVTATVRSSSQPVTGGWYYDRIEWWASILSVPPPRVLVLQDLDRVPAFGAFIGEVHANIALALACVGCVTNGAVRDLPQIEALGFQLFAGSVSPSHAYSHIVDWGQPVEIGGQKIRPGELVHGDRHGVHTIPASIAADIPALVARLRRNEQALIDACRVPGFSIDVLSAAFDRARQADPHPPAAVSPAGSASEERQ